MRIVLNANSIDDYRTFLRIKSLPTYRIRGREAWFPDEYAERLGLREQSSKAMPYEPWPGLFDYQRDIAAMAIQKRKFAAFADCGLGKTFIMGEFVRHARQAMRKKQRALIVSPLMVVPQTVAEFQRFYGDALPIEIVGSSDLNKWLRGSGGVGITNYEALRDDVTAGNLGCFVLDESSILKSAYGKFGQKCVELGKGIEWKLCATGTPAPNDRIEYGTHAVFLDQFPNINAFLARYFVNRGQTDNRWELKPHALEPFYRALSHWCIFLSNPAVYGWKDNCGTLPPINVHIEDVELTAQQEASVREHTGGLFAYNIGGITSRNVLGRIAKGYHDGEQVETLKPAYIVNRIQSWPDESTIVWCLYNDEQDRLAQLMPDAANISGDTPHEKRIELIDDFKAGRRKVLISKGKILGYGLNLQRCTRMVFSGLQDSYETYYQCVKRANRIGSKLPLNVHIPCTDIERPMLDTVLVKAKRVQEDTDAQERLFYRSSQADHHGKAN